MYVSFFPKTYHTVRSVCATDAEVFSCESEELLVMSLTGMIRDVFLLWPKEGALTELYMLFTSMNCSLRRSEFRTVCCYTKLMAFLIKKKRILWHRRCEFGALWILSDFRFFIFGVTQLADVIKHMMWFTLNTAFWHPGIGNNDCTILRGHWSYWKREIVLSVLIWVPSVHVRFRYQRWCLIHLLSSLEWFIRKDKVCRVSRILPVCLMM